MADLEYKFNQFAIKIKNDLISSLNDNLEGLKCEISELVKNLNRLENHVTYLQSRIESIEKESRLCDLVVTGIPILPDENLANIVDKIGETINFDINCKSCQIFRIKNKSAKQRTAPPIILKFPTKFLAFDCYKKYRAKKTLNLSDIGFGCSNSRIYINCGLTSQDSYIHYEAKKLQKTGLIHKVFIKSGSVYALKTTSSQPLQLKNKLDIESMIGNITDDIALTTKSKNQPTTSKPTQSPSSLEPRITRATVKSSSLT